MRPADTTAAGEEARRELVAAARERLRRALAEELSAAGTEGAETSATAEVQEFLERLGRQGDSP